MKKAHKTRNRVFLSWLKDQPSPRSTVYGQGRFSFQLKSPIHKAGGTETHAEISCQYFKKTTRPLHQRERLKTRHKDAKPSPELTQRSAAGTPARPSCSRLDETKGFCGSCFHPHPAQRPGVSTEQQELRPCTPCSTQTPKSPPAFLLRKADSTCPSTTRPPHPVTASLHLLNRENENCSNPKPPIPTAPGHPPARPA